uniref:ABC-transporter extension domain-containing protein n=1 Tax=Oryza barthii TaxID=65489 RepID=A0A0D3G559_9ORYZ
MWVVSTDPVLMGRAVGALVASASASPAPLHALVASIRSPWTSSTRAASTAPLGVRPPPPLPSAPLPRVPDPLRRHATAHVRLVSVNSAGKTTHLRIAAGLEDPDTGNVVKAKKNVRIASLSQEFEVCALLTIREEFLAAFEEEMEVRSRLEKVQAALEGATEDMDLGRLLDELDLLQRRLQDVEDPDLVLLDELINHVDLDTIVWLESHLKTQEVPMIVETVFGMSKTHKANYSEYVLAKAIWVETQYATWEKQQEEIEQTKELINRLGAGVNAGRVWSEQKVVFF